MPPLRLLLVEDVLSFARALQALLRAASDAEVEIQHVETLQQAQLALRTQRFECVLLDLHLPDGEGLECVERLRAVDPSTAIVVLTGLDDRTLAIEALRRGAQEYAVKGEHPPDELVRLIRHAIERNRVLNALNEQRAKEVEAAHHDAVTGLPNRQLLQERARGLLAEAERNGTRAALLFFDLDGFKGVNDRHGHDAGDLVLREVARVLRQAVREPDIASRVGGDEFVVLLTRLHEGSEALAVAERVVRRVAAVTQVEDMPVVIGASAGVAIFREHGNTLGELLASADAAMYEAKRAGKGAVRLSTTGHGPVPATGDAAADCTLVYQPWVSLQDQSVVGVEALLAPGPDSPLRTVDRAGDADPLGRKVLRESVRQWQAWRARGLAPKRLAVNLASSELHAHGFAAARLDLLAELGMAPAQLQFEVPEEAMVFMDDALLADLERLRAAGVRLAIGHFGRTQAALASIARLPPDAVKLDTSVLHRLRAGDRAARAVAAGVVAFTQALGVECCAVGVETAADLDACRELGVDAVQGYWLARPLAAGECTAWLARQRDMVMRRA